MQLKVVGYTVDENQEPLVTVRIQDQDCFPHQQAEQHAHVCYVEFVDQTEQWLILLCLAKKLPVS